MLVYYLQFSASGEEIFLNTVLTNAFLQIGFEIVADILIMYCGSRYAGKAYHVAFSRVGLTAWFCTAFLVTAVGVEYVGSGWGWVGFSVK